jgi:hypothetical protein
MAITPKMTRMTPKKGRSCTILKSAQGYSQKGVVWLIVRNISIANRKHRADTRSRDLSSRVIFLIWIPPMNLAVDGRYRLWPKIMCSP